MQNNNVYALIIGTGDYEEMNIVNLPTYRMDLTMIGSAIMSGLKVPKDNVRILAGEDNNGYVRTLDIAKAISNFQSLLTEEDTFIFYYSGHGKDGNLILSNGQLELQSVINYVEKLPSKNKIAILDCCYSGKFETQGAHQMHFYDTVEDFAGHGIAIMASSAANEVSRLGPGNNHSMFTGALSTAIAMNKRIEKGRLSLNAINEEMQFLVSAWNKQNPSKEQQPIFRTSMGGTIYFQVEEYTPYQTMTFEKEAESYRIVSVEPLSSLEEKRLCAFVIPKNHCELTDLPLITKEVAGQIKYAEIFSTDKSEKQFERMPATAVWCYFGRDESDIVNHLHFAYTIWARDKKTQDKYFKSNRNAIVIDDIYVFENKSYDMLKKMQEPTVSREQFIDDNRKLLASIINMAELFIVDLQEVVNKTITIEKMQQKYEDWIIRVRKRYLRLTDGDIAPDDLHDWSEEIVSLAGWILDLSLLLENRKDDGIIGEREMWLIKNAIKHYHESLEKLKELEVNIDD